MTMKQLLLLCLVILPLKLSAQADLRLLEKRAILRFGGGSLAPSADFASVGTNGIYARNGFQLNAGFSYCFYRNLGIGVHLDYNQFGFDRSAFSANQQNPGMTVLSPLNSTRFGLSALAFLPIRLGKTVALNFYAEGQAGLRGMNIPKIDLTYGELGNNFTSVAYRPRPSTMGYLAISGGLQVLFSRNFGLFVAYHKTLDSRHSISYSSRAFDADGLLIEGEHYLHNYLGSTGIQGGIMFVIGK